MVDQALKPPRLELDRQTPNAAAIYRHWLRCFKTYLVASATTDGNKMGLLISRVGPRVYQMLEDAADYDAALLVLDDQYNRAQNEVSARHALPEMPTSTFLPYFVRFL